VINFSRAFETAWERMTVILFRPFDLGKWFAIGFSAFLAGLLAGGNGVNTSFRGNMNNNTRFQERATMTGNTAQAQFNQIHAQFSHFLSSTAFWLVVTIIVAVAVFILVLTLLFIWLGARGQFMLLDNIVRNRGAVSWPWQNYARQANSFFLLYFLLSPAFSLVILPIMIVAIMIAIPLFPQQRWPNGGEITVFALLGVCYLIVAIAGGIVMFLYREFGPAIMFRKGVWARAAFLETMRLVRRFPGSMAVFILLRIAIFIGLFVLCLVLCCLTILLCCLSQWPYLGTLLLLPVLIYVRCFTLDCLAQFGPEFDVFTVDVPPTTPPNAIPPLTPPPPLG